MSSFLWKNAFIDRGSNPTTVRFESNVSALSELSINCTMAWVIDMQVRAILYATLAVS